VHKTADPAANMTRPPKNDGRPPKRPPTPTGEQTKLSDNKSGIVEEAKKMVDKVQSATPANKSRPADRRPSEKKNPKREEASSFIPKFPVSLRESVYDNVKDLSDNEDDEGIDNDYSDDSGTPPKVSRCG
jgi:hypothetical protein